MSILNNYIAEKQNYCSLAWICSRITPVKVNHHWIIRINDNEIILYHLPFHILNENLLIRYWFTILLLFYDTNPKLLNFVICYVIYLYNKYIPPLALNNIEQYFLDLEMAVCRTRFIFYKFEIISIDCQLAI